MQRAPPENAMPAKVNLGKCNAKVKIIENAMPKKDAKSRFLKTKESTRLSVTYRSVWYDPVLGSSQQDVGFPTILRAV